MNYSETLQLWHIPVIKEPPDISSEVKMFLTDWCTKKTNECLLLTEREDLNATAAADVAALAIQSLIQENLIQHFAYRVNGIGLWTEQNVRPDSEIAGKISSCDLLWVEELAGGTLTEHQRTLLYAFILQIKHQEKRAIISVSTNVETLGAWFGEVVAKVLFRNFTVLEV